MLGHPPAAAARCPVPSAPASAVSEPARSSNDALFLIPLPALSSCRSYLTYLRQPDVTDGGAEIASTSAKIVLTGLPKLSRSGLFPSRICSLPPPLVKPAGLLPAFPPGAVRDPPSPGAMAGDCLSAAPGTHCWGRDVARGPQ